MIGERELALTDHELGWLGSAYVIVLSLAALPLGVVGDLKSRRAVIAFGVGLWSAFTALGATVSRFWQLTVAPRDRKSTRLNSSHQIISYAVFCPKKKN